MKDRAYAKINLSLDVFNVRENGYHDISSIMLPIDFYDELEISFAKEDSFSCNRYFLRYNEHNSIYKMIEAVREKFGFDDHYAIRLKKTVPMQAGLGGGTADAAGTLRILEKLHHLRLSREEIIELCLKIGADVPFNYFNVPAIVEGIGDVITPIDVAKTYHLLLVKPKSGVSTREAYETLDMERCAHPDIAGLAKALKEGSPIDGLLGNSLEQPALMLNGEIRKVKEKLLSYHTGEVLMSGSGSAVFVIGENREEILKIHEDLRGSRYYVRFTETLNPKQI